MRELITDALLKRLRPGDEPYEVRDTRVTGFLLRVQPSDVRTFYVEYAHGKRMSLGHPKPARPGVTISHARRRAEQIRGRVADGEDPVVAARKGRNVTLG